MSSLKDLIKELNLLANPEKAKNLSRFFKTGKGEYGEGDQFIGITVPFLHKIANKYTDLSLSDIEKLIQSPIHEYRLTSLMILVNQFKKVDNPLQAKRIFDFYLSHTDRINNWDLVDLSAGYIVGGYLIDKPISILIKLAKSKNIWERRIAIIATFKFIYEKRYKETFTIAKLLLNDTHDLIHKAVGWMLREVGKRCGEKIEEEFLIKHYKKMPRTMLRYAIERFSKEKRQTYLKGLL